MSVDFGRTARDYQRYRAGFPDALFERLARFRIGLPGQRVLDVGCGTGALGIGFARRGCPVIAFDKSVSMLLEARGRSSTSPGEDLVTTNAHSEPRTSVRADARTAGDPVLSHCVAGVAESLPFSDRSFDVVAAGQCWHWFDRTKAATEARRVIVPGGFLLIAHFDWLPLPGNVVAATEALVLRYNPTWTRGGGNGLYPQWADDFRGARFEGIESFSFDVSVPHGHQAWRGRMRASSGVGASMSDDLIARFDSDLVELLRRDFPREPLDVPHRVFAIFARRPRED